MIEDSQLVVRAKSGDADAFGELVRRHQLDIRAFLRHRIRDAATADDLAQEVFLGAMQTIDRFEQSSSVRTWLMSIARFKLIDFLRTRARRKTVSLDVEAVLDRLRIERLESDDHGDEKILATLKACIESLKPAARRLVDDYYFQDIASTAIAERTRQKSSTVRMTLMRIRGALGKCIRRRLGGNIEP